MYLPMRLFPLIGLILVFAFILPPVSAVVSCNDITLSPDSVTLTEKQDTKSLTFDILNKSNEEFTLFDVIVSENSNSFDMDVRDFPDEIPGEDNVTMHLEYDTPDVNGDIEGTFTISLKGEFENGKNCSFSQLQFTIDATVKDGDNACFQTQVNAGNASLDESTDIEKTISLTNNSNNDFILDGFEVFDDSSFFVAKPKILFSNGDFVKKVSANSTQEYVVKIIASAVDDDETETVFIEVRGHYSNGAVCETGEINGEFDVTVNNTGLGGGVCADVKVNAIPLSVEEGQTIPNQISLQNNSSQDFFIDSFKITDSNYQAEFDHFSSPSKIESLESGDLTFDSIGYQFGKSFDGNAALVLNGHFDSGITCTISGTKIPFFFHSNNVMDCSAFTYDISPYAIVKGSASVPITFTNPLSHSAVVSLSLSPNGIVSPNTFVIGAQQSITKDISLFNAQDNAQLLVHVSLPNCPEIVTQSSILFSDEENAPVQLVNAPAQAMLNSNNELVLTLTNQSIFPKEAKITIVGKPDNKSLVKNIAFAPKSSPTIYFPAGFLAHDVVAIVTIESDGYIVAHSIQLQNTNPVPLNANISENPVGSNQYVVNVTIHNPLSQPLEGNVRIPLPQNWKIRENTHLVLQANETRQLHYTIEPNGWVTQPQIITVYFDGELYSSAPIALQAIPSKNPLANATGLITGGNGFWLGVLVLIALLLIWNFSRSHKMGFVGTSDLNDTPDPAWVAGGVQSQTPFVNVKATPTAFIAKAPAKESAPASASGEEEFEEEPWMNPGKQ